MLIEPRCTSLHSADGWFMEVASCWGFFPLLAARQFPEVECLWRVSCKKDFFIKDISKMRELNAPVCTNFIELVRSHVLSLQAVAEWCWWGQGGSLLVPAEQRAITAGTLHQKPNAESFKHLFFPWQKVISVEVEVYKQHWVGNATGVYSVEVFMNSQYSSL